MSPSSPASGPVGTFAGFPVEGLDFFDDLSADNSKAFWSENKHVWQRAVRTPLEQLCAELAPEFGPASFFRPYRDVRFSADKSAYKTHQGALVGDRSARYYVQVSAEGLMAGAGLPHLASDQLARYRSAVDDERRGNALQDLTRAASDAGFTVDGDQLATRPRGVAADHPRLELLRHKSLIVWRQHGSPAWVSTPEARDHVAADWRTLAGVVDWLATHVGDSDLGDQAGSGGARGRGRR